ncbi:MAG: MBL fold metallo-hydrolase [Anaerolineae bacterium]|nr:MBL fold metallo-hydrolase [Anaerolineae bacterium]
MALRMVAPGLYELAVGIANVWLLEAADGLALVDTGQPGRAPDILAAIRSLGKPPADLKHILLTHNHPDHIGSLAAVQRETGARVYCQPLDAPLVRTGGDFNPRAVDAVPFNPAPGVPGLLYRVFLSPYTGIEPSPVHEEICEGAAIPALPDLQVIETPGHSAGHLAYLWQRGGGVLIAGDVCSRLPVLDWSLGYADFEEAKRSLKKLCAVAFDAVVLGHGAPILRGAKARWLRRWGGSQLLAISG